VFSWFKKKKKKRRETCKEIEKGLVIFVHDLNRMSVASCRCNEKKKIKKKKSLKEAKVAYIVFGPLMAHYLYSAFVVLFQTQTHFSS
jgi:hypothetical protein